MSLWIAEISCPYCGRLALGAVQTLTEEDPRRVYCRCPETARIKEAKR